MPIATRNRRVIPRTLALAVTCLTLSALLAWTPTPATGFNQASAEATVWQLLNGARANNGRAPLQQNGTLVGLARWRSKDMIERNYFGHTILGCGCKVYRYYDSNGLSYVDGGENIGWNNGMSDAQSPVSIHEGFMNSAGHRSNVLNATWTHGGVGAFGANNINFLGQVRSPRMYTQLFMQARSAAPPPPPPPAPAPTPRPVVAPAPPPPAPTTTRPPSSGSAPAAPTSPAAGAGSGPAAVAPAPVATPTPAPRPHVVQVAPPRRPDSSRPLEGGTVVMPLSPRSFGATAADAVDDPRAGPSQPAATIHASLRIEASPPAERGFVETIVGSLLGLLFH